MAILIEQVLPSIAAWLGSGQLEHGFYGATSYVCFTDLEQVCLSRNRVCLPAQMDTATLF